MFQKQPLRPFEFPASLGTNPKDAGEGSIRSQHVLEAELRSERAVFEAAEVEEGKGKGRTTLPDSLAIIRLGLIFRE
jgi:hypothetical protein